MTEKDFKKILHDHNVQYVMRMKQCADKYHKARDTYHFFDKSLSRIFISEWSHHYEIVRGAVVYGQYKHCLPNMKLVSVDELKRDAQL